MAINDAIPNSDSAAPAAPPKMQKAGIAGLMAIMAYGAVIFAWGLGSYEFWEPWEPKYALAIQEMMARGDYLTPYLDDEIRWTKPILHYWTILPLTMTAGVNEWTMRLPSALAALAGLLVTYFCISRIRTPRTGLIAAFVLGSTPQYFYLARQAMPDMLMAVCLLAAMNFFAVARFGNGDSRRWFLLAYASLALAFMTKGPVTIVLAFGAIGISLLMELGSDGENGIRSFTLDWKSTMNRFHILPGLALAGIIALPWYLYMMVAHWHGFWSEFIGYENIERFVEPIREHHGTVTYYIGTICHGMYPWSAVLPGAMMFLFADKSVEDPDARQRWYFMSWFLAAFLLFSAAGTKLQHYLLPAVAPMAVLIAIFWEDYEAKKRPAWAITVLLLSILFLYLPIRDFIVEGNRDILGNFTNRRSIHVDGLNRMLIFVLAAWTLTGIAGATVARGSRFVAGACIYIAVLNAGFFSLHVLPRHTVRDARNVTPYTSLVSERMKNGAELVVYGKMRYSAYYYAGRKHVTNFEEDETDSFLQFVRDKPEVYVIVQDNFTTALGKKLKRKTEHYWKKLSAEVDDYDLIGGRIGRPWPEPDTSVVEREISAAADRIPLEDPDAEDSTDRDRTGTGSPSRDTPASTAPPAPGQM
ncbi:MAG: glycosyltransferase family 39 protein [Candidatus Hydrogenedentota bacterium]